MSAPARNAPWPLTLNLSTRLGPTCRDEKMMCPIKGYRIYIPSLKALLRKRFHALALLLQGALLKLLQPPESNEADEHALSFLFRLLIHVLSFNTSKFVLSERLSYPSAWINIFLEHSPSLYACSTRSNCSIVNLDAIAIPVVEPVERGYWKMALDSTLSTCTQPDTSRINQWINPDMIN